MRKPDNENFLAYNENGDLQEYESWANQVTCPACGKVYLQQCEDQVPGFRDRSEDICPYCKALNGSSMSVEYSNYPIEGQ